MRIRGRRARSYLFLPLSLSSRNTRYRDKRIRVRAYSGAGTARFPINLRDKKSNPYARAYETRLDTDNTDARRRFCPSISRGVRVAPLARARATRNDIYPIQNNNGGLCRGHFDVD